MKEYFTINQSIKFFIITLAYFALVGCGGTEVRSNSTDIDQPVITLDEDENITLVTEENNTDAEVISTDTEEHVNSTVSYGVELLRHAGNENGPLQKNKEKWQGSFHMLRDHQDKKFLLAGNEAWSYIYQAFSTKIGETYKVKAVLVGADESRDGNFEGGSIVAIADEEPTSYASSEIAQSQRITGNIATEVNFTFVATSTISYALLRGDTRYRYPNLHSLSVKQITSGTPDIDDTTAAVVIEKDTIKPIITLAGESSVTLTVGESYRDAGATAKDNVDGDITAKIQTRSNVDASTAGNYTVTYTVSDAAGNSDSMSRSVYVKAAAVVIEKDTIKPIITLAGESSVTLTVGESYRDAGATAKDNVDGDITAKIQTRSNVDASTAGNYTVTYTVSDAAGNSDSMSRSVYVKAAAVVIEKDTIKPIITLAGESSVTLTVGESYRDAGATAKDNVDGDITAKIQTRSNVDASTAGNYTVTYTVSDAAGNSDSMSRSVYVKAAAVVIEKDTIKPIITLAGESSVTLTVGESYRDAGATAKDNVDGDITAKIQTRSNVDASTAGNYTVTYTVSDAAGNSDSMSRSVAIQNKPVSNTKYPWDHGKLKISANKRMLQHEDGTGFFWMGDTAWQMTLKLKKEDIPLYFDKRKAEGFNVSLITIESWQGMKNRYNEAAFNSFYTDPNESFWKYIDFIINEAAKRGIYIALLPSWGDVIKNSGDATVYGKWVANRYKNRKNIIWVVGGDQNADTSQKRAIFDAMGSAIDSVVGSKQLITYHPSGTRSSADWFKNERWLDFNMIQSGHCMKAEDIIRSIFNVKYNADKSRPILDGESRYETIEECFYRNDRSGHRFNAKDVRDMAYKEVFSGAFGHTYGHQSVWTMYENGDTVVTGGTPVKTWKEALDDPGAGQMQYLVNLIESRPMTSRVPDQSIVVSGNGIATRGNGYIFIYLPNGGNITVNLGKISGSNVKAWWYNPATGDATEIGDYTNSGTQQFTTGNDDRVLVIDDLSKGYGTPGL